MSSIGLADDTALVASSITDLRFLLHLTLDFCKRYNFNLVSSKTKLLVYSTKQSKAESDIELLSSPLILDGSPLNPVSEARHLGVVRSPTGNGQLISDRISAHRKAVFGLLHTGLALSHNGNPCSALRVNNVYGVPILFSG